MTIDRDRPPNRFPELSAGQENSSRWSAPVGLAMDRTLARLESDGVAAFHRALVAELADLRTVAGPDWADEVVPVVRRHEAVAVARECPLTWHATIWPRGYPADADFVDRIYRHGDSGSANLPERGRRLHALNQSSRPSQAIRQRRLLLAEAIDSAAAAVSGCEILALGCGHLREAEWSLALAEGSVGRFLAADRDQESLFRLERDYGARFPVIAPTPLPAGPVRPDGLGHLGRFHLIYSAGVFETLEREPAQALVAALFGMLHPGGKLLIGNLAEGLAEAAYMESAMDWPVQWRCVREIAALADAVPAAEVAGRRTFSIPPQSCLYLELIRGEVEKDDSGRGRES